MYHNAVTNATPYHTSLRDESQKVTDCGGKNTLYISGFVDGIMFSNNGPRSGVTLLQQNAHNVVDGPTPCRVVSHTTEKRCQE